MKNFLLLAITACFIQSTHAQIINAYAGTGVAGYSGNNGPAILAKIDSPLGINSDSQGNIYFSEQGNHTIRKVTPGGIITTIAGTGTPGSGGDGGPATLAQFNNPSALHINSQGDVFIADYMNHRVRKINGTTGIITSVAGNGSFGYSGDNGPATAANLAYPTGVTLDAAGNIYIADQGNQRVRRVDAVTGIITTVAGNGTSGYSGDGGQALAAQIGNPYDIKLDPYGNLIFSEVFNAVIRKVDMSTGIISTVAGTGTSGFSGDGGPATSATIATPEGISVDHAGNVYIAALNNARIRKVDAVTGIISTVAGNGTYTLTGNGGPAVQAGMDPCAVGYLGTNLYICDLNHQVRVIEDAISGVAPVIGEKSNYVVSPNPVITDFTIQGIEKPTMVHLFDMSGNLVLETVYRKDESIDISDLSKGMYLIQIDNQKIPLIKH